MKGKTSPSVGGHQKRDTSLFPPPKRRIGEACAHLLLRPSSLVSNLASMSLSPPPKPRDSGFCVRLCETLLLLSTHADMPGILLAAALHCAAEPKPHIYFCRLCHCLGRQALTPSPGAATHTRARYPRGWENPRSENFNVEREHGRRTINGPVSSPPPSYPLIPAPPPLLGQVDARLEEHTLSNCSESIYPVRWSSRSGSTPSIALEWSIFKAQAYPCSESSTLVEASLLARVPVAEVEKFKSDDSALMADS